uniref:Uncharacterized protein n=1 Tax=Anguilla anguilla TaxID=7936 RepID=A0A0E9W1F1_ANGAN
MGRPCSAVAYLRSCAE